jgi:hypothetical protein
MAEAVGRTAEHVGELKCGERCPGLVRNAGNCFSAAALDEGRHERIWVEEHAASLPDLRAILNYVLTTMC